MEDIGVWSANPYVAEPRPIGTAIAQGSLTMTSLRATALSAALVAMAGAAFLGAAAATAQEPTTAAADPCPHEPRVLILTAMPLELHPLLDAATVDVDERVRVGDKTFHPAELAGQPVILAMTGIGLVNAEITTEAALAHFGCQVERIVFSGVAGSKHQIGDVAVPAEWTMDGGRTWHGVDPDMLAAAEALEGTEAVELTQVVPVGDAACLCPGVDPGTPVDLGRRPEVFVGGRGTSGDTYGGKALPCIPGGGDVFGCEPCLGRAGTVEDALAFASNVPDYADPAFIEDFFQPPEQTTDSYEAQDQESAAVARVAEEHDVPYLAVRAASDGQGDPLNLPGFPFQFFAYRNLAGDNAAAVTTAWLELWAETSATASAGSR